MYKRTGKRKKENGLTSVCVCVCGRSRWVCGRSLPLSSTHAESARAITVMNEYSKGDEHIEGAVVSLSASSCSLHTDYPFSSKWSESLDELFGHFGKSNVCHFRGFRGRPQTF